MKTTSLLFCALLASATIAARADELYAPEQFNAPSTLTRAQVKAETLRALKNGEISFGDVEAPPAGPTRPGRSRADVKQELRQALAAHEVQFGDATLPAVVATGPGRTRAEVRAEMLDAKVHPDPYLVELYRN